MTAIKTVEYAFPVLASLADNTLTALTQITVYLPEDSKVFKSVVAELSADDIITATGGTIASRRIDISVNGATATSVTNSNVITHTGENISLQSSGDFTSHFTTNWGTATSRTVDCSVLIDQSSGTTLGWVNVCVTLRITYEYDEASATHVKTVWIPLNAPVGALATSKPGSAVDTIPDLSTYCPEASKTFRQINIVVQGNTQHNAATTDSTLSIEIDSAGAQTSDNHEGALASDRFFRRVFQGQSFSTSSSHSFYIWGSVARYNHLQVWMVVTYEFSPGSTTRILQSLWLPAALGLIPGDGAGNCSRASVDLWIAEPGTISDVKIALFAYWLGFGAISGLNARVGTGSFVAYTDSGGVFAGGSALMVRNDGAFTLARGRNTLTADVYRTDTADWGWGMSGQFLVCYTADVPSQGVAAANHTVMWYLQTHGTQPAAAINDPFDFSGDLAIPESDYFISSALVLLSVFSDGPFSHTVSVRSNSTARWEQDRPIGVQSVFRDQEYGNIIIAIDITQSVKAWPADQRDRFDLEATDLVWSIACVSGNNWLTAALCVTYHAITFSVAGNVSDSGGGTVDLTLHRASDGEQLASTSRTGDGAYSMTWYDDTEAVYVVGHEDATHVGASAPDTAA